MLHIQLFGQFQIQRNGAEINIDSQPAQELLAYLLLPPGRTLRREKVAGVLWPDATGENARTYLRQALWRVRKAIGAAYILADRMTVAFDATADFMVDTAVLETEPAGGWTIDSLIAAVSVYAGDLLPGFYSDWAIRERERYHALYHQRMELLISDLLAAARWDEVLHWGETWLARGPAPEPAYRALMKAHAALADLTSMTAVYRRCVAALEEELGVAPSAETQALFERLRQGTGPEQPPSAPATALPAEGRHPAMPPLFSAEAHPAAEPPEAFVGRQQELKTLDSYLQPVLDRRGGVVFVTGEAGQGKTTLLREFARRAQAAHPELIVAAGACPVFTSVCAPYGLFRAVLETLTGDVEAAWAAGFVNRAQAERLWTLLPEAIDSLIQYGPHLIGALVSAERLIERAEMAAIRPEQRERLHTLATSSPKEENRLLEQGKLFAEFADVLIALTRKRPLLLILDDLHWADSSSIGLLGHLGHRLSAGAMLLAGAYRPEEVTQGRNHEPHPLVPVLGEYKRRFGQILIPLNETSAENERAFIDAYLDQEANDLDEAFRHALARHTRGHPLFTVELLREMQTRGILRRDDADRWVVDPDFNWDVVPPRVEGVIETRVSQLDPELIQWLDLASIEGETFTAEVIARAFDIKPRVVVNRLSHELDRQLRLVRVQGLHHTGGQRLSLYQFRHSLFRQYLYQQLDDIERSYLHQQVGELLEALYRPQVAEIADQLAHHFHQAGRVYKAVAYLILAGEQAGAVYAYDEAKEFYSLALALARQNASPRRSDDQLTDLYLQLGRVLEHNLDTAGALTVYQEMAEEGRSRADQHMVLMSLVAQGTLFSIASPIHDPHRGLSISTAALALAQELGDRAAEARILQILMIASEYNNQMEKAISYGEKSLALARELDLTRQVAFSLGDLGGCYWIMGQVARARELLQEAETIWRESGNLPMLADVLVQSSFATMFQGDFTRAIALSDEVRQIGQAIGNEWNLAFSRSRIGFAHRARGDLARSMAAAEESLHLGRMHDLYNPQIFAGAELAFTYAYLGLGEQGLAVAQTALQVVDQHVPSYRPYLLAAVAEIHLVDGDLEQAATAIHQARTDPYWQAYPVLCFAPLLADGRLALAQQEYRRADQLTAALIEELRQHDVGAYLPEALDLSGQALVHLGRPAAARRQFTAARDAAEAMQARGYLWLILHHQSELETDPQEADQLRQQAGEIVDFIAGHAGKTAFRNAFFALPAVKAVHE